RGAREKTSNPTDETQSSDCRYSSGRALPDRALGRAPRDGDGTPGNRSYGRNRRDLGGRPLSMAKPVLLGTPPAIWLMNGDPISEESRTSIRAAQTANLGVYISPITAWEIATLVSKNRIQLSLAPEAWFDALLEFAGVRLAAMPPKVLIASANLPGTPPRDPVDRILAATGRAFGYTIITRYGELARYGRAGHVEMVRC